ncbi:MAG: HK97 gp10 family phage protein [Rhodoferax sp.]|nr:HK97-gp10 family putative phage morphogenesis protein [Rhodoferax sp.]MDP3650901.1 HK97 gp10 family phage protein [Rhodoferax sp.]
MSANVKGLKELQAFLDQLPAKMEANIMRAALRQGAKVVLSEAKGNVPIKTGALKAGLRISTNSRRGVVTAKIKAGGKHAHIAKWLEYGVAAHFIKPKKAKSLFFAGLMRDGVDHPGIAPKPFLRPALDSQSQAALLAVGEAIKKRLTKQGLDASGVDLEAS